MFVALSALIIASEAVNGSLVNTNFFPVSYYHSAGAAWEASGMVDIRFNSFDFIWSNSTQSC